MLLAHLGRPCKHFLGDDFTAIQPTREEARDTGTLEAYAHLYDVESLRQEIGSGGLKGSDSIIIEDGQATLDCDFINEYYGFTAISYATDYTLANLGVDTNHRLRVVPIVSYSDMYGAMRVPNNSHYLTFYTGALGVDDAKLGEHFAGDALYYDSEQGLMVKVGQGLHIQNDEIDIDQDGLPLASAANRGTVKVGTGLAIDAEGVLSADLSGALNALNYTFTDTLIVNLTGGVTSTVIAYDDIVHKHVAGKERYEVYKANFTFSVPQAYTAGTSLVFSFTFSYNGANVTAARQTMATVIDKGTGKVVGNYVTKYTTGTAAKYTLTVPVTETIPAKTNLVVLMNYI